MFQAVVTVEVVPTSSILNAKNDIRAFANTSDVVSDFRIQGETNTGFDVTFKVEASSYVEAETKIESFFNSFNGHRRDQQTPLTLSSDLLMPA